MTLERYGTYHFVLSLNAVHYLLLVNTAKICCTFGVFRLDTPDSSAVFVCGTHLWIINNLLDPTLASYPLLNYALRGFWRGGLRHELRTQLPITPDILQKIYLLWSQTPQDCLGFLGFLCARGSSLVSLCKHLPLICSPHRMWQWILTLHLHTWWSFCVGARMILLKQVLGCILVPQCPVYSMMRYLAIRPSKPGPLFLFRDGSTLSHPVFMPGTLKCRNGLFWIQWT